MSVRMKICVSKCEDEECEEEGVGEREEDEGGGCVPLVLLHATYKGHAGIVCVSERASE